MTPRPERLTVCFPFSGDVVGGSHISALKLIAHIDRARYHPLVLVQRPGSELAELFRREGIPIDHSLTWNEAPFAAKVTPGAWLRSLRDLVPMVRFLRRRKVDIVHTNDGRTSASWALPARLAGARLVWHHRGDPGSAGLRFAAPLLASHVVTVSEFALPPPGLLSGLVPTTVVHSPFDTALQVDRDAARACLLDEAGLARDTLCLAYSGWFIERKRPLLFVDTVARLRDMMPERPVAGLMFGKGEDTRLLRAIERRIDQQGLRGRVRLMGWKTPGAFWIAACDQLVVPAVREPFGRTLIEAMLVGTSVVAVRSGGNAEALRGGRLGMLVEPEDDAEALARACLQLAQDPLLTATMRETAMRDTRQRFGLDRHSLAIEAIYERLAGHRRAGGAAAARRLWRANTEG